MWIFFALLTAFCYAAASMVVKYSVTKVVRNQNGLTVIHAWCALALTTILWLVTGHEMLDSATNLAFALASGAIIGFAAIWYFKVLAVEDASSTQILMCMATPMALILGIAFLGDRVSWAQAGAAALILSGAVLVSWSPKGLHLRDKKTLPYMGIATFGWAICSLLGAAGVENNGVVAFTQFQTLGYAMFTVFASLLHHPTRRATRENLRPVRWQTFAVITLSEAIFICAILSQLRAFREANPGLVLSVSSVEGLLAIALGAVLTRFLPSAIKEIVDRKTISLKIAAALIVVTGISVLNLVS